MKTDVDVCLSSLQAGTDRRVLMNSVDRNYKFKIISTSDNVLKNLEV